MVKSSQFADGTLVRLIAGDLRISESTYVVTAERDHRGNLIVKGQNNQLIKANRRRVLPADQTKLAFVHSLAGPGCPSKAVCPICGISYPIRPAAKRMRCPEHGLFALSWQFVRKHHKSAKAGGLMASIKTRPKQESKPINFAALAKLGQVWTKGGVNFDHPRIEVKAHVLLIRGRATRKICFNSYNGCLGRKQTNVDLVALARNTHAHNSQLAIYAVKDHEKEEARLKKAGYERLSSVLLTRVRRRRRSS